MNKRKKRKEKEIKEFFGNILNRLDIDQSLLNKFIK